VLRRKAREVSHVGSKKKLFCGVFMKYCCVYEPLGRSNLGRREECIISYFLCRDNRKCDMHRLQTGENKNFSEVSQTGKNLE